MTIIFSWSQQTIKIRTIDTSSFWHVCKVCVYNGLAKTIDTLKAMSTFIIKLFFSKTVTFLVHACNYALSTSLSIQHEFCRDRKMKEIYSWWNYCCHEYFNLLKCGCVCVCVCVCARACLSLNPYICIYLFIGKRKLFS